MVSEKEKRKCMRLGLAGFVRDHNSQIHCATSAVKTNHEITEFPEVQLQRNTDPPCVLQPSALDEP